MGLFSRALVVRGGNLHAWVESNLDGRGFTVLDPTPDIGIPPAESRLSWKKLFTNLGHEIEFFYDRRILGFDSLDQVRIFEAVREAVSGAGRGLASWKEMLGGRGIRRVAAVVLLLILAVAVLVLARRRVRRMPVTEATRAYLAIRRLVVSGQ